MDTSELERRFTVDNYSSPISALGNRVVTKIIFKSKLMKLIYIVQKKEKNEQI